MMTLKELTEHINKSENKDQLKNFEATFELPQESLKEEFKGVVSVYRYFKKQLKGWEDLGESIPKILLESKEFARKMLNSIEALTDNNQYNFRENLLELRNFTTKGDKERYGHRKGLTRIFTVESSETAFLIQLSKDFPDTIYGAVEFLSNPQIQLEGIDTNMFKGYLQAYEFRFPDEKRAKRRDLEDTTINKLKADLNKTIDQ